MKTCTCPHEATRNGFLRTGYNSLCPFHGKPLPDVSKVVRLDDAHVVAALPICGDCELRHAPDVRCDYVDET